MSYPRYEIFRDSAGAHRFHLRAGNAEIILASQGYTSKQHCQSGISSCQVNSQYDFKYARLYSINGEHYFNLKAGNGEIIGTSQMYASSAGMETGISAVKKDGITNTVVDNSYANA